MSRDKQEVLERLAAIEELTAAVIAGEKRYCTTCRELLVYRDAHSGYHPGVFCPNGCTAILMEMRPSGDKL